MTEITLAQDMSLWGLINQAGWVVKAVMVLLLAASDRVWIYWVGFAGRAVDGALAARAPGLRAFAWGNLAAWLAYLWLSGPAWPVLPFWPFAPGSGGPMDAVWVPVADVKLGV
jgi:hypothetical protein